MEDETTALQRHLQGVRAPQLVVLYGGIEEDVIRATVSVKERQMRFIVDRKMASRVAELANDEMVRVPKMHVTAKIRTELTGRLTSADGPLTVIPHTVLKDAIVSRTRRVQQDMEIIAGYPQPTDRILISVLYDFRELLRDVAERGRSPVVIHDLIGIFAVKPEPDIVFFASPDADEMTPVSDGADSLDLNDVEVEQPEIDIDTVRSHADFIADSDVETLKRMCPLLELPAMRGLRRFWHDSFEILKEDEEDDRLRRRAQRRLAETWGVS